MLKRAFDIAFSLTVLVALSPLFLILAILVKASSSGPIFYQATRIGQFGRPFKAYKFRSMIVDADKVGPAVTTSGDPRITPIGRFLRKSKFDELPQFLNVLLGDMSIVGPRPEAPKYVELYTEEQRKVLNVRPGITSPASIEFRDEESILTGGDWEVQYIEEIMPQKLAIDLEYAQNASLVEDLKIISATVRSIIK